MARKNIDRQALRQQIQELDIDNELKSQLLQAVSEQKRYGLVWEDHKEYAEEELREKIPVLIEQKDKAIISSPSKGDERGSSPNHILIEGDNLHALTALTYTHEGMVDVIYIDPPYNTGAKNWKYNNNYVDGTDSYKHSKWLTMMNKRLIIAKKLLSESGILLLTIDDYECHTIRLLLDEIFGEDNRLGTFIIKNNPSGRSTLTGVSISHEYAFVYSKRNEVKLGRLPRNDKQLSRYKEKDKIGYFEWVNFRKHGGYKEDAPTMYYPIYIDKKGLSFRIPKLSWDNSLKEYDILELPLENEFVSYPIDEEGRPRRWKWSLERALSDQSDMSVKLDRTKTPSVYIKARMKDEGMLPLTIWDDKRYSSTEYGNNLLSSILGGKYFDYPKSLFAVIDSLKIANALKSSTILDFFAGSGTTLHATMQLNAEDGGHRKCILVTNNENNICEEVTYERNKRVIEGYTTPKGVAVEGLHDNNLRYYKVGFTEREDTAANRLKLMRLATDMLCIQNDIYDEQEMFGTLQFKSRFVRYFTSTSTDSAQAKQMLVVYEPRAIEHIAKELRNNPTLASKDHKLIIYAYSDGGYAYTDEFEGLLDKVELIAMPDALNKALRNVLPAPLLSPEGEDGMPLSDNISNENTNQNTSPSGRTGGPSL